MSVKLHIEQAQRSKIFRIQSEIKELEIVTKGMDQNSFIKQKTEEYFQWKTNGSYSKGDSCSFLHLYDSGNSRDISGRNEEHRSIKSQVSR